MTLRSVYSKDGETHWLLKNECSFYPECRHALKVISRLHMGLSDTRPLSSRAIYQMKAEGRLLWLWATRISRLNNDEATKKKNLWTARGFSLHVCRSHQRAYRQNTITNMRRTYFGDTYEILSNAPRPMLVENIKSIYARAQLSDFSWCPVTYIDWWRYMISNYWEIKAAATIQLFVRRRGL